MSVTTSIYWQHSNNQELITTVHKYWQGEDTLSDREITLLSDYLHRWIKNKASNYPKKEQHLVAAKKAKEIEEIKVLSNRMMDWGINPW